MYSQYDEQSYILAAVGDKVGRFLDVGAWNPTTFSNTRALFERGWSGVMFEPSPEPMLNLLKEYGDEPRVELVCAAVGMDRGLVPFHVTRDCVSTSCESVYQQLRATGGYYGAFLAARVTLEEIGARFGSFDFVNFDAEGLSADLCLRYLALGNRPPCICVEHDGRESEILEAAGAIYQLRYGNGTNLVLSL